MTRDDALPAKEKTQETKRVAKIPYVHWLSHGMKRVASRYGVDVVFSAENKVGHICSAVSKKIGKPQQCQKRGCAIKHVKQFVPCASGVVYKIPLSCGKAYIGQTGRCLNVRLREHNSSLIGRPFTHLALHCKGCDQGSCKPAFDHTTVIYKNRGSVHREIVEAFVIQREGLDCISHPSISLQEREIAFLERHLTLAC